MQDCGNSSELQMELLQWCTGSSNWSCQNGSALDFVYTQLLIKYAAPDLWPTAPIPPSIPLALYRPCYTDSGRDNRSYEYIKPERTVVYGIISNILELSNEEKLNITTMICHWYNGVMLFNNQAWNSYTSNGKRSILNFQVSLTQAPLIEVFS